jgi:hypothetical protein
MLGEVAKQNQLQEECTLATVMFTQTLKTYKTIWGNK